MFMCVCCACCWHATFEGQVALLAQRSHRRFAFSSTFFFCDQTAKKKSSDRFEEENSLKDRFPRRPNVCPSLRHRQPLKAGGVRQAHAEFRCTLCSNKYTNPSSTIHAQHITHPTRSWSQTTKCESYNEGMGMAFDIRVP